MESEKDVDLWQLPPDNPSARRWTLMTWGMSLSIVFATTGCVLLNKPTFRWYSAGLEYMAFLFSCFWFVSYRMTQYRVARFRRVPAKFFSRFCWRISLMFVLDCVCIYIGRSAVGPYLKFVGSMLLILPFSQKYFLVIEPL
jgi:hypothetical protein